MKWLAALYVITLIICIWNLAYMALWTVIAIMVFIVHFGVMAVLGWMLIRRMHFFTPSAQRLVGVGMALACLYLCAFFVGEFLHVHDGPISVVH